MISTISSLILWCNSNALTRFFKLKHIAHKVYTIALVLFYYAQVEHIPMKKRLTQNDTVLFSFLASQHLIACLHLDLHQNNFQKGISWITILVLVVLGIVVLAWPVLAWFDFDCTQVDTDYWSVRFIFYGMYVGVMNALRFDSLDCCQLLIGEGFLVS